MQSLLGRSATRVSFFDWPNSVDRHHHADPGTAPIQVFIIYPFRIKCNIFPENTNFIRKGKGSLATESFNIAFVSAGSIVIQTKFRSISCARQLSSVFVDVYPDGGDTPLAANSIQIPRSCFFVEGDVFTTLIGENDIRASTSTCNIVGISNWQPLNRCRHQYKIVLVTEYSSQWKSSPFVWNHFLTAKEGGVDGLSQMNICKR